MKFLKKSESGLAQLIVLGVMALLAAALPVTTKLVQKSQENRSKAAEEKVFSCSELRSFNRNYFDVCNNFDNVCFNKFTGEYQGCGNINGSNGGDCTDPEHNTNAGQNILCSTKSDVSLSCETLHNEKQKYFSKCAEGKYSGVCFDKQTGEYKGCTLNGSNDCNKTTIVTDGSEKVYCSVKSDEVTSWTSISGKCGSAYGKVFEATPTNGLCEVGDVSREWFSVNDNRYYWRCGNVEKLGNETANCFATVNGIPGSAKIILDHDRVSLGVGQKIQINARLEPATSTDKITWTSNMPDFFSVDSNGVITMIKGSGSGMVTAMTSSGNGAVVLVDTSINTTKVDGVCGTANGGVFVSAPEKDLCKGLVTVYGKREGNKYTWVCVGANGGLSSNCEATIDASLVQKGTPTPLPIINQDAFLFLRSNKNIYSVGQTFSVIVGVNSGSNKIGGVDGVMSYDASILSLLSVKKSSSMVFKNAGDDCVVGKNISPGKISFTCFSSDNSKSVVVNGELVILNFSVKKNTDSKISFECTPGSTIESNIVSNGGDIINCGRNVGLSVATSIPFPKPTLVVGNCTNNSDRCDGNNYQICKNGIWFTYKTCRNGCDAQGKFCILPATSVAITSSTTTMKVGESFQFKAQIIPTDSTDKVFWHVSSSATYGKIIDADTNTGVMTALGEGQFTIMAKTIDTNGNIKDNIKSKEIIVKILNTTAVDGKCGGGRNICDFGTVNDGAIADTSSEYKWKCVGINGGATKICTLKKSVSVKVNGKCANKRNTCASGSVSVMVNSSVMYQWRCVGKNGGVTTVCSIRK